MGILNHSFNLMLDLIKENFGNLSGEFDQILYKSENHTIEHAELDSKFNKLQANMNNLISLIDQLHLKFKNESERVKLQSKYEINKVTNQIKFNYKNLVEEIPKLLSKFNLTLIS